MHSTVYLFHGFNVRDRGGSTTDRLAPYFEDAGCRVREVDYLWTGLLGVRLCNRRIAMALSQLIEPGSVAVGHSNGCAIIDAACWYGAPLSRIAYINPALDSDAELAPQVESLAVWHSPSDVPTRLARFLPWHAWGRMGSTGYRGSDARVVNYNKESGYERVSRAHSDIFEQENLKCFGPLVVKSVGVAPFAEDQ